MPQELDDDPFAYLLDGLFVTSAVIYLVNKFVFKEIFSHGFCHAYVNDLICIPFNLPPMLWVLRRLGLRLDDRPPSLWEIAGAVVAFSFVFEVWLPMVPVHSRYIYSDPWDVVCYTFSGIVGALWWRRAYPAWR